MLISRNQENSGLLYAVVHKNEVHYWLYVPFPKFHHIIDGGCNAVLPVATLLHSNRLLTYSLQTN